MTSNVSELINNAEHINGISRLYADKTAVGFYSVFNNVVVLDVAIDTETDEYITEGKRYDFLKGFEPILTKKYGHCYCPIHSRKMTDGICDVCN